MTSDSPAATAASFSAGQSSGHVPIVCGALRGILFHGRLENGRSLCIRVGKTKDLISPCEFERRGGKVATRNWKRSIHCDGKPIGDFLLDSISSAGKRCCRFVLCSDLLSPCVPSSVTSSGLPDPVVNNLVTASMSSCAGSPTSSISADADRYAPLCDGAALPSNRSVHTPLASSGRNGSCDVASCALCGKVVATIAALWQHVNSTHISRGCIPPLSFFQRFDRLICSNPSCRFAYSNKWSTCQRSLGGSRKCGARLVDPSSLPDLVPLTSASSSPAFSSGPTGSPSAIHSAPDLSTKDMLSIAIQAAVDCHIPSEYSCLESTIFNTIMTTLFSLPVHTVRHVPRAARPLLASALCREFSLSVRHGLWGFVRLLLLPKLVLRSPPRAGRKKRYLVGALLQDRLKQWMSGTGISDLWCAACAEGALFRSSTSSTTENLASSNNRRAIRWASEGRYGNALQALGSLGVASFDNASAKEELHRRHPQSELPSPSPSVPAPLTVQPSIVLSALRSFQRGTSPGSSALRPQHLLDAVCGSTAPASVECLNSLTCCINSLLAGTLDSRLAPWFCGAPLTALAKKTGGFRPIAVGETLRRLVSKVCCLSVRSLLPDQLLPFGQVGVGISGGLEAAVHSMRSILSLYGSDSSLCCLKLDMTNAFNECSRSNFLSRCHADLPELFAWVQWCYCCAGELRFGPHRILSTTGVQQGDPLGPLLFSLVLRDFLSNCPVPDGLHFQLWYLNDGILVGTPSALSSFLDDLQLRGPSYGLHPNLSKCEVFWPSGDQSFTDFPPAVKRVVLPQAGGIDFLGSPIWGSPEFLSAFVGSVVDRVSALQERLRDLGDPQVELHLLRSCLGVCKLNHLLRTIPPGCVDSELLRFDDNLRHSLSSICNASISDQSWLQATLPCSLGGLGLRGAHRASSAAFLGCCISSFALCSQLLSAYSGSSISISSIPGKELAISCLSALLSGTPIMEVPASQFSEAQRLYQFQLDTCQSSSLLSSCSLRDQARIRAISSHPCASAWLRAIPSVSLGLTMSRQEFVCSLWYWLGIPVFASTDSIRCSCGNVVDRFGDHLLGCGHGPMRIRRHDALCDIVFHALLQGNSGCKREQRCGSGLDRPGDVYHPDFLYGKPAYFDVTVRNSLQGSLLSQSAVTAGVAASRGEVEKDAHHEEAVLGAGGIFIPLAVESLGLWSPASLKILRDIAVRATNRSGVSAAVACHHFIEQLSICLWRHNSHMFLHLFSLLPVSPLWELSPGVGSSAHGFCHSEPWACDT